MADECLYNSAMELLNNKKKYTEAYKAFNDISYKDSTEMADKCLLLLKKEDLKDIEKGDIIKFGYYEQDNNTKNGKEEIEWIVLAVKKKKALLISRYALDCKRYHSIETDITWQNCTLRSWLNNVFIDEAFSPTFQKLIISSNLPADKNPEYRTDSGAATTDKVFLLSLKEADDYFTSDNARRCVPTEYAFAQGAYPSNRFSIGGTPTCWWWLRSSGHVQYAAATVDHGGVIFYGGDEVGNKIACVRPAIWISLDD